MRYVCIKSWYSGCPIHDGRSDSGYLSFYNSIKSYFKDITDNLNQEEFDELYSTKTGKVVAEVVLRTEPGSHRYWISSYEIFRGPKKLQTKWNVVDNGSGQPKLERL